MGSDFPCLGNLDFWYLLAWMILSFIHSSPFFLMFVHTREFLEPSFSNCFWVTYRGRVCVIGCIFYAFLVSLNLRSAVAEIDPLCCFCSLVTSGAGPQSLTSILCIGGSKHHGQEHSPKDKPASFQPCLCSLLARWSWARCFIPKPQFHHLQNGDNNITCLIGLLRTE